MIHHLTPVTRAVRRAIVPPSSDGIYSDTDYPDTDYAEPTLSNQRWVGGAGASDANDGTQGNPWATLAKAFEEMSASTSAGWYCLNFGADLTESVGFNTRLMSGTGPGTLSQFAILRGDPALPTPPVLTINAQINIDGESHWLWHDFDMAGKDGFRLGENNIMTHHTVRNVIGNMSDGGDGSTIGDNVGHFYTLNQNPNYLGVFNCNFTGPGISLPVPQNTAAILTFRTKNLRWENNIVTNYPRPLYYKHSNRNIDGAADVHIRKNYIPQATGENCFFAGRAEGGVWEIVDNIFAGNVEISNGGGGEVPDGMNYHYNTTGGKLKLGGGTSNAQNIDIKNNIIEGNLELLPAGVITNTSTSNYNLIGGSIVYQSTTYDLPTWQGSSVPAGQDVNSIAGTPTYAGGANPSTIAGFALAGGSLGKAASSDGLDMGANVASVGNM